MTPNQQQPQIPVSITDNEELDDFLNSSSESIHIVSGDSIIVWANQTELDLLGYSAKDYIGKSVTKFHKDPEIISDILEKLVAGQTLKNYAAHLISSDGTIKDVLINSNGYFKDGIFSHTRCYTRDVTGVMDISKIVLENIEQIRKKNQK